MYIGVIMHEGLLEEVVHVNANDHSVAQRKLDAYKDSLIKCESSDVNRNPNFSVILLDTDNIKTIDRLYYREV